MPKQVVAGWGFPWKGNSWNGGAVYGLFESQSWSGNASYGLFESQSWSGGASVSGVNFSLTYPQGGASPTSAFHFFFKVAAAPASDMTLVDLNAGPSGYIRVKLTNSLHVFLEYSWPHNTAVTTEAWDISTVAVAPATWYWVGVSNLGPDNFRYEFFGNVRSAGGSLGGNVGQPSGIGFWDGTGDSHGISFTVIAGMGKSLSSGYLAFPNTAGWEMGKFQLLRNAFSMPSVPSSDPSGGDLLFNARQTVGVAAQLNDTSGNGFNALASSQGLTINVDGPYP